VVGRTRAPAGPSDARPARDAYIRGRPALPPRRPLLCRTEPLCPVALGPVAPSSTQRPYRRGTAPLTCSLDHRRAPRAAHFFAPAATSPEQGAPRLTPVAAAVRPCQHHHRPKLLLESSLGTPLVALRPRPAGPGRRFARICWTAAGRCPRTTLQSPESF
jgi:hypothetical protein